MNIESYTFEEFKQLAENFHGYAAPGLLVGGYMVAMAKRFLPEGTLFEAVVETNKCLPDAVQLLTLCSTGNGWMKVHNLGRYALSLYDKFTGEGVRVNISVPALDNYPEIKGWMLKLKAKKDQDTNQLLKEIEMAGESICVSMPITIKKRFTGHKKGMQNIICCSLCGEAYPGNDGPVCRGCSGEAPYVTVKRTLATPSISVVPVEEAVGKVIAHDMTRITPGQFKGAEFKAGQRITVGDICRLQLMGRFNVAVQNDGEIDKENVHENDAAEAFAKKMAGLGINYALPPSEGKVDFVAAIDGLLCVDYKLMQEFNMLPHVMACSRQDATMVKRGSKLAGTRIIPLHVEQKIFDTALDILDKGPLFQVKPLRKAKVGILVTGTEIFQGIIEDKFIPIISAKVQAYDCTVVKSVIVPDDMAQMKTAISEILAAGADLLITTGGLSVDPDDITRQALLDIGLTDVFHGVPVLPGTMSLMGNIHLDDKKVQVLGVPACALYYKTTFLDIILPRILADREISRAELARMGEGGYCMTCHICSYPKCWFCK